MSRRSQQKRAARAKSRARERARASSRAAAGSSARHEEFFDFTKMFAPPGAAEILKAAVDGMPFDLWVQELRELDEASFLAEAELVVLGWVRELYGAGWQPTELIRFARQLGKAGTADLTRLAVAAERDVRGGPTASDTRWLRQWSAARLPEQAVGKGWLTRWAATTVSWAESLHRLAGVRYSAPNLELLLPPPPGVRASKPMVGMPVASAPNPMLDRIRALLAKAESTEHESEALAFTGKAQELMTRHAISQAMVTHTHAEPGGPSITRLEIDAPYADVKALLLQNIAKHSRCRAVFSAEVGLSSVVGFAEDLEVVEMLFVSLLVQAQHALTELTADAPAGSRARSQPFKASFLQGFVGRIDQRLEEANQEAFDEAKEDSDTFLPVLRARDEQVNEFMERQFVHTTSAGVRGGYDPLGYSQGEQAAAEASLVAGRVEG